MHKGLLIDFTKCVGCGACADACREVNDLPQPDPAGSPPQDLDGSNYTVVLTHEAAGKEPLHYRKLCMHCEEPACVSACPVGALTKRPDGPVVYDSGLCFGCRYCMTACPFQVPRYTWERLAPVVSKCILCYHRLDKGQEPACAAVCPTGATRFGPRDVLLRIARERIKAHPELYVNHIYGEREGGGTDVLMLSPVPFEQLGFRTDVPHKALPDLTWVVQEKIPNIVLTGGVFLGGLYWLVNRRMRLAKDSERPCEEQDQ
ncbi:MAG: 4Fe-4S dicluster domain-containing protein [Candidatus Eisenbacteria sp.]|nr:4Fe-4S dicluster domain-containing protein [Candidatus Eisenbacteria bacterium]